LRGYLAGYPVISPPGSFATNQLATKKSPRHQPTNQLFFVLLSTAKLNIFKLVQQNTNSASVLHTVQLNKVELGLFGGELVGGETS